MMKVESKKGVQSVLHGILQEAENKNVERMTCDPRQMTNHSHVTHKYCRFCRAPIESGMEPLHWLLYRFLRKQWGTG